LLVGGAPLRVRYPPRRRLRAAVDLRGRLRRDRARRLRRLFPQCLGESRDRVHLRHPRSQQRRQRTLNAAPRNHCGSGRAARRPVPDQLLAGAWLIWPSAEFGSIVTARSPRLTTPTSSLPSQTTRRRIEFCRMRLTASFKLSDGPIETIFEPQNSRSGVAFGSFSTARQFTTMSRSVTIPLIVPPSVITTSPMLCSRIKRAAS